MQHFLTLTNCTTTLWLAKCPIWLTTPVKSQVPSFWHGCSWQYGLLQFGPSKPSMHIQVKLSPVLGSEVKTNLSPKLHSCNCCMSDILTCLTRNCRHNKPTAEEWSLLDVMMCHYISSSQHFKRSWCLYLHELLPQPHSVMSQKTWTSSSTAMRA